MTTLLFKSFASFVHDPTIKNYCYDPPFDPSELFPELPFITKTNSPNAVYSMVRRLLIDMELDAPNIGTRNWNPFKMLISPGNTVVIKPNFVTHYHFLGKKAALASVVHGSVIRPLIDYVALALQSKGKIIIADNPVENADFSEIMTITGVEEMVEELNRRGYPVEVNLLDLRPKIKKTTKRGKFFYETQEGDPLGYITIDLNRFSSFAELDGQRNIHYYTLADYSIDHLDPRSCRQSITDQFHNSVWHKYVVSRTILNADVVVNVAKLKTHCKAGATLSLKNMVGIVHEKKCLPHHRPGLPPEGDSFPDYPPSSYTSLKKLYRFLRNCLGVDRLWGLSWLRKLMQKRNILIDQHIEHGNWRGNDTIWRTILDLNRIVVYADKEGVMKDTPQRRFFVLIDGIIGQQGQGPMSGVPLTASILLGGFNPVYVDALAAKSMGIDIWRIPSISKAADISRWKLIQEDDLNVWLSSVKVPVFNFKMPKGWM